MFRKILNAITLSWIAFVIVFRLICNYIELYLDTFALELLMPLASVAILVINLGFLFSKVEKKRVIINIVCLVLVLSCSYAFNVAIERDFFFGETIRKFEMNDDLTNTRLKFREGNNFEVVVTVVPFFQEVFVGKIKYSDDSIYLEAINACSKNEWWHQLVNEKNTLIAIENSSLFFTEVTNAPN